MMRTASLATTSVMLLLANASGCTSTYTVSVRHIQTQQSTADAPVTVTSLPRMYSFLDLRHYVLGCGKMHVVESTTDEHGATTFTMPADATVGRVMLDNRWFAYPSSDETVWVPMMTQQEMELWTHADDLRPLPERPEMRMSRH